MKDVQFHDDVFKTDIARKIWDEKYRFKDNSFPGSEDEEIVHDVTPQDTWQRVAHTVAAAEAPELREIWEQNFRDILEDFNYLPAGRITAGAGTERNVTLFNCFVMGTVPDSMHGIFDAVKEAALTMQQGGGIGYDFSTLRPKGTPVVGVGSDASGPLSFMDVWDAMCRTILSAGSRRGAMMATMICTHPDIESFIEAKHETGRLRMFNMSVLVTDAFVNAVKHDADWHLTWNGETHKVVRARDLWNRMMQATYDYAEPGVIFIDRINDQNNLNYCETIAATNPCGEQPLPPYGACLLGSVNLVRLITNAFEDDAHLDRALLEDRVEKAVRFMDNVIEVSNFPLEEQRREAQDKRRIGLGLTGLADALLMVGLRYGSDEAAAQAEEWMRTITNAAYRASARLAAEKGPFPLYNADAFQASPMVAKLDADVQELIATHGVRNGLLTTIAPNGTISLYAGNVSSGCEPVFAWSFNRKILNDDGSHTTEEVVDYAVARYRAKFGITDDADLPAHFVNAQDLNPGEHVLMQSALQKWVDSSISKTINVPAEITFDEFKDVYMQAYDQGCKGCTTYRPNEVTGSILSVSEDEAEKEKADGATVEHLELNKDERCAPLPSDSPMPRDEVLHGRTYKLDWPIQAHSYYITINDIVDPFGQSRPFEIFIVTKNVDSIHWINALSRMMSAVFRRGGNVDFVAHELREIHDTRGGCWMHGRYVPSVIAALGDILLRHMRETGFLDDGADGSSVASTVAFSGDDAGQASAKAGETPCPCGAGGTMIKSGGCGTCTDCGFSQCG